MLTRASLPRQKDDELKAEVANKKKDRGEKAHIGMLNRSNRLMNFSAQQMQGDWQGR